MFMFTRRCDASQAQESLSEDRVASGCEKAAKAQRLCLTGCELIAKREILNGANDATTRQNLRSEAIRTTFKCRQTASFTQGF